MGILKHGMVEQDSVQGYCRTKNEDVLRVYYLRQTSKRIQRSGKTEQAEDWDYSRGWGNSWKRNIGIIYR